jgi:hypothetical protein
MRPEYDFSGGVRGKYADRFGAGASFASSSWRPTLLTHFAPLAP